MIFLYPEGYEKTVLNSDDQQNEQPPKSLITKKRPQQIMLEIQTLGLDRHKNVVQLNQLMGPPPSWWLYLQRQYKYKQTV